MIDQLGLRFARSISTYNNAALIQTEMAHKLTTVIREVGSSFHHVYEIGAGTGLLTRQLASSLQMSSLWVNDLCDAMQQPISAILQEFPALHWEFIAGDAEKLDIPGHPDLVASSAVFQWFDHLPDFLQKLGGQINEDGILAFSTFGEQNLHECKSVSGKGINYIPLDQVKEMVCCHFDILHFEETEKVLYFDSALDVLLHLKQTGVNSFGKMPANENGTSCSPLIWTKKHLNDFCSQYEQQFGHNEACPLTYHPAWFVCRKK
jgi:malonyl-CoA O-methyltransferase